MKYISKNQTPTAFKQWKVNERRRLRRALTYDDLNGKPIKDDLKRELLGEQNWICCYCCVSIDLDTSHIEHVIPRCICSPQQALAYDNLVASCNGGPSRSHCGHSKDRWHSRTSFVSPLRSICETYFGYSADGQITPAQDFNTSHAAKTTIDKLNLNDYDLTEGRKAALDELGYYSEKLTRQDAEQIIEMFSNPDTNGRMYSYCTAIVYLMSLELEYLE